MGIASLIGRASTRGCNVKHGYVMQKTQNDRSDRREELLNTLVAARDEVRLRRHLLSLEAKQRWFDLESRIALLQSLLEQEGDRLTEGVVGSVHDLTQAAHTLFNEGPRSVVLSTPASQFMNTPVTCFEYDYVDKPAQLMLEFDCGLIPVVNTYWALVGLVTDRDVCMAAQTHGQSLYAMRVDSVMSRTIHSVAPNTSLQAIYAVLTEHKIRRVPVVQDRQLVGIVAIADIAHWLDIHGHASGPAGAELVHTLAAISAPRGVVRGAIAQ